MASISKEQAKAIAAGFLDSGGISKSGVQFPVLERMLAEVAQKFLENAIANLEPTTQSGELAKTLTSSITRTGSTIELLLGYKKDSKAAAYWAYINKGVKGTESGEGDFQFKTKYPSKKMATAILLWYRKGAGRAYVSDVAKYGAHGAIEEKGSRLKATISKADNLKRLAYATATNIKKHGIKPTHYFDKAQEETLGPALRDALTAALAAEIVITIRKWDQE